MKRIIILFLFCLINFKLFGDEFAYTQPKIEPTPIKNSWYTNPESWDLSNHNFSELYYVTDELYYCEYSEIITNWSNYPNTFRVQFGWNNKTNNYEEFLDCPYSSYLKGQVVSNKWFFIYNTKNSTSGSLLLSSEKIKEIIITKELKEIDTTNIINIDTYYWSDDLKAYTNEISGKTIKFENNKWINK